ncbi:Transposon Ty3-G Gag-Pol polyprotein [Labeo rohita]|uniref:Gypsy retrotransposon integrase-like protein 1 n=1 Tax=Labeo rohita TaxID=84645 RepID=A0ABQ8MC08_LABRO|nr:Transposon Ty3-G Gag-Pol polyprotein [Labeo rohita]
MAAVSTFPTPFLPCPGEPAIPFDTWLRMFQNYLLVVGASGDAWPIERKRALLLHCLGTEGQRLFYTLPNQGDSMEDAIVALKAHFAPRRNIVAERHAFRKRVQAPGESIVQYVAALRDLASTCDFAATLDEMLRDQLVENVSSHRIRERLLLESELTLDKAITIASQIEAAGEQAKFLSGNRSVPVQAIHAKPTTPPASGRRRRRPPLKPPPAAHASKPSSTALASLPHECYRCGSKKQNTSQSASLSELTYLRFRSFTWSSVSILPKIVYDTHFKNDALQPPLVRLVTYSRAPIPVLGCLPVTVSKDDFTCSTSFFVVESGTALLGMDLINELHLRFEGNSILPAHTSAPVLRLSTLTPLPALGCAKGFVHKVKISSAVAPVRQKLRRSLPLSVKDAVSEEIWHLLVLGVERVDAPWVSPIVVVQKKSGAIRMCVDLREPNKAVVTDSYPLPHIEEMLSLLRGATVFSTIDLESAYFQLPLHEESRDLTSFITHDGLFRFCRVPYGLASAPSAFQKILVTDLQGLPNVANYLHDIILWGHTQTEHDHMLKAVVQRLQDAGLKLNQSKCQFNKTSLRFLGHLMRITSPLFFMHQPQKMSPNSALSLAYYREAQQCFDVVKSLLVQSPILSLFDPKLPTVVSTDASSYGLGAVLAQIHEDKTERIVAFASRTLSSAERKYSTIEREALACVWAIEKWQTYLWGRKFLLRTDHQALTVLFSSKGTDRAGMCIARWASRLLCFNYEPEFVIVHKSVSCAVDSILRPYFQLRDELSVQQDYVFRGSRLVVPVTLRHTLVKLAHEGHQGIVRTKQRLLELYWWPGIDCLVKEYIQACQLCLSSDKTANTSAAPLQPVPFPSTPWDKVAVDVVGPFDTAQSSIVSDNGTQFTSAEFSTFLRERDIRHIRTSLYHPAANGAVERFHRVLKSCIQSAVLEAKPWKPTVTEFLQVYRATPHSATGLSPFELLNGRKMRTRLNVLPPPTTHQDAPALLQRVSLKQKKMKAYTNSRRVARTPDFKPGDWVHVRIPTHVPKAHPRFTYPRQIVRKLGACTYRWHASHLARSVTPVSEDTGMDPVDLSVQVLPSLSPPAPPAPPAPKVLQRASARVSRPPRWLDDYVT